MENFDGIMKIIISIFNGYYVNVRYLTLLIISIALCFALTKKEEKNNRLVLVYLPIILFLIIMNPYVYSFIVPYTKGVYWRFFWLIPLAPVVSYVFTTIIKEKEGQFAKVFSIILGIIVIGLSGSYMFSEKNFQKVYNIYKAPDDILGAIMIISAENKDNKKVMCPTDFISWVRQYDSEIKLEYKRIAVGGYNKFVNDFDLGVINKYMDKYLTDGCNFIVLNKSIQYDANLEDYGYSKIGETITYYVYMLNE